MNPVVVRAISEDVPGPQWAEHAHQLWPHYRTWFLHEGELARPTYLASERALRRHMPELLPLYTELVDLAGGSDHVARFLSCWRPPTYAAGCSQAVWLHGPPLLVRTYDYAPMLWEHTVWRTCWLDRAVVGFSDSLWGLLDGINDAGLAMSLAFGGRRVAGEGFGIPLVIRYALQVCSTTQEAVAVLRRVPCHMAHTVTVVDAEGRHATVFLSPDRSPRVTEELAATNHQGRVEWPHHALSTASVARLEQIQDAAADPVLDREAFTRRFLTAPVWSDAHASGAGTLYAAAYDPSARSLTALWPGTRWPLPLHGFEAGVRSLDGGPPAAHPS